MAQLRSEQLSLRSKNVDLQANISSLEREKKDLEARLDMATLYRSDNFLATATGKKSEKLVIRASRAKKLNLAFEIPQNLSEDLSFKSLRQPETLFHRMTKICHGVTRRMRGSLPPACLQQQANSRSQGGWCSTTL
jgi:hypothetical protein